MYIYDMLSQSPISRNVSSETLVTGKKELHLLGRHLLLTMFASSTIIMIKIIIIIIITGNLSQNSLI